MNVQATTPAVDMTRSETPNTPTVQGVAMPTGRGTGTRPLDYPAMRRREAERRQKEENTPEDDAKDPDTEYELLVDPHGRSKK